MTNWFKKKSDPISERARALNAEIAALESKIKKLTAQESQSAAGNHQSLSPQPAHVEQRPPPSSAHLPRESRRSQASAEAGAPASSPQPRLRSTALPHHRNTVPAPPAKNVEPVLEEMEQQRLQRPAQPPEPRDELDVRKNGWLPFWQRLKNHFRGPPASNPKLVNYLAAGSIQGLRPLRYERRVARNRFIVLVICLVLVLWGLIAVFFKHR